MAKRERETERQATQTDETPEENQTEFKMNEDQVEEELEDELEDIKDYASRIKWAVLHHRQMAQSHLNTAERLIEKAREEGVNIQIDEFSGERRGRRSRRRHGQSSTEEGHNLAHEPAQPGGQGRVTDPSKDKRLKENESPKLAAARSNMQDDDRGQVQDPAHDRRIKGNRDE